MTKLTIFFTVVLGKLKMMSAMAIRNLRLEHKKIKVETRLRKMYFGRKKYGTRGDWFARKRVLDCLQASENTSLN